ncbi:MAG: M20/M25/M40 family metallo-hydrolase [Cyclobacteriaceae bacterium]|nr:M20/M25/M40 family metallo-hydrolase [Cyclobacteriaceae bacterium]MCH8515729.1 M20/M25/M40 family metallo-hydrolase [Cyclobacteriaceae bacterium]
MNKEILSSDVDAQADELSLAVNLLRQLIQIPSFSREEAKTADLIEHFLKDHVGMSYRSGNNVWAYAHPYQKELPTLWLNSHHDTVKPNAGYTNDPFGAEVRGDQLFGLGSNDAGGCLVSLMATFLYFAKQDEPLPYNLLMVASAEEEISGKGGMESLIGQLPEAEVCVVGEPTGMLAAVAERGLIVADLEVKGRSGHAAREEGESAIYKALPDMQFMSGFQFQKQSKYLGASKASLTVLNSGTQHNVVPDTCSMTIDIRLTDAYTPAEALAELQGGLSAPLKARSTRLKPSFLPQNHKMYQLLERLEIERFGSATLSDQALIPYPSVKIGPGLSERSHTADEFVLISELEAGIGGYKRLLANYFWGDFKR